METVTAAIGVASAGVGVMGDLAGIDKEKADLESRQRMARINSDQSETVALADLKRQISNIRAIRASAGASLEAPTFVAIEGEERKVSDENRAKVRAGYKLEELQAKADKSLLKRKRMFAYAGGALKASKSLATLLPDE